MVRTSGLYVNGFLLHILDEQPDAFLLTVFRDEMYHSKQERLHEPWDDNVDPEEIDAEVTTHEYMTQGQVIKDRLDMLGISAHDAIRSLLDQASRGAETFNLMGRGDAVKTLMRQKLHENVERLNEITAESWISRVKTLGLPEGKSLDSLVDTHGELWWLLQLALGQGTLYLLRLLLEVFPDASVELDLSELEIGGEFEYSKDLCERSMEYVRLTGSDYAPVVVLTEGKSDALILSRALKILFPHLVDFVKFIDYGQKPESNAANLVKLVKSFDAAGIANRIVAVFDNDSAASEALMSIDTRMLSKNIRVIQYPNIPLGESYPTWGTARTSSEQPKIVLAEVNGRAGSIELYLGQDVLCVDGANLVPVQWGGYMSKIGKYQGKITQKGELQKRFEEKAKNAEADRGLIQKRDWEGLRAILEEIKRPFH